MAERSLACAEWQDDLAAALMAQIDPEREAALQAHVETCTACRTELDSLQAVAAVSLGVAPDWARDPWRAPAPAALGDRIVAAVGAQRRDRRLRRLAMGAVAAAAVVAVVVGAVVLRDDGSGPSGTEVAFAVVPTGATASAVVAPEGTGSVVELVAEGLDPSVTYALWVTPPGGSWDERVPAGTFRPDDGGRVEVRLPSALPAQATDRVWATTPDGQIALDTARQ